MDKMDLWMMRNTRQPNKLSLQCFIPKNWSARQELHLRSLGPRPSVLLLHSALLAPGVAVDAGAGEHETFNPGNGLAVRF